MPTRRYVKGDRAFSRLLAKLPDSVTDELRGQLNTAGRTIVALQRRRAPVYGGPSRKDRTPGALQSGLSYSVTPTRLTLKVGLVGKPINRKLFYGWFVERGRKEQVVTATRQGTLGRALSAKLEVRTNSYKRTALLSGIKGAYKLHVRAMQPRHFVYIEGLREQVYPAFRNIWDQALKKAAAGVSDS